MVNIITLAILREEEFYKGIKLPTPQKSGTVTQQVSYAKQQAQIIAKKLIK